MSGHNKWSKLKHTKGKTDQARANVFTKMSRELALIAKAGSDPNANGRLRDAIAKARKLNMSNDQINRAISKSADSANLEEILYEGYGLHGVAVVVECLTDNRNRTAGDMRHLFDKYGAGLGAPNSAIFMFQKTGQVFVSANKNAEEEIMLAAIDAGAENIEWNEEGGGFLLTCEPCTASALVAAVTKFGEVEGETAYLPISTVALTEAQMTQIEKLCDALDENDDVQNVYHNGITG